MSKKSFFWALLKMLSIYVTWAGALDQMEAQFGKAINAVLLVSREHIGRVQVHVILGPCYVHRGRLPLVWNHQIFIAVGGPEFIVLEEDIYLDVLQCIYLIDHPIRKLEEMDLFNSVSEMLYLTPFNFRPMRNTSRKGKGKRKPRPTYVPERLGASHSENLLAYHLHLFILAKKHTKT